MVFLKGLTNITPMNQKGDSFFFKPLFNADIKIPTLIHPKSQLI